MENIPPHKYPLWIYAFLCSLILLFFIGLGLLSPYKQAAMKILLAEKAYHSSEYVDSIEYYLDALDLTPFSRKAKKGLALSVFSHPEIPIEDKKLGLEALEGISLEGKDWEKISAVMPKEFLEYFETTKW